MLVRSLERASDSIRPQTAVIAKEALALWGELQEDIRQPARSLADGLPQLPGNALPEEPDKTQAPVLIAEPAPGPIQATLDNFTECNSVLRLWSNNPNMFKTLFG
jgi:hypothetical protein